jgi:hypothetical protein
MFDRIVERVGAVPGVENAANMLIVPMSGSGWNQRVFVGGVVQEGLSNFNQVGPTFFDTLETPLVAGRPFDVRDRVGSPRVAIVNETFARKYLPNRSPIGQFFQIDSAPGEPQPQFEVVGLVRDSKYTDLREEPIPIGYFPLAQEPEPEPEGPGEEQPGEPGEPQTPEIPEVPGEAPGGEAPETGGGLPRTGLAALQLALLGFVLLLVGARLRVIAKRRRSRTPEPSEPAYGEPWEEQPGASYVARRVEHHDEPEPEQYEEHDTDWPFPDPDEPAPTGLLLPSTASARRQARATAEEDD